MAKKASATEAEVAQVATPPAGADVTTPAAATAEAPNPFDAVEQKPTGVAPVATPDQITALREKIKALDPKAAAQIVEAIANETRRKRSANDILNTVFSLIGGAAKFAVK